MALKLAGALTLRAAAACVLRESFNQFTANLDVLRTSDEPEVVHQARIAWRRFRSAMRLFKPALAGHARPVGTAQSSLSSLLKRLGALRDLDVAWHDTLPPLQAAYTAGDAQRMKAWQSMHKALQQAAARQRQTVRHALRDPAVDAALVAVTAWLQALDDAQTDTDTGRREDRYTSLRAWSEHRMARLHRQLKNARKDVGNPEGQHRLRILAKRMRYNLEALHAVLPQRRSQRWRQQAAKLQLRLGATRDLMQACTLVARLDNGHGVAEFVRGLLSQRSPII